MQYDWLNKRLSSVLLVGVALELKSVVETNLITIRVVLYKAVYHDTINDHTQCNHLQHLPGFRISTCFYIVTLVVLIHSLFIISVAVTKITKE